MNWQNDLAKFEQSKEWDTAIRYMQDIIAENPHSAEAAICMNYLLMNLLVEEDFDFTKHDYYASLAKKYFKESYEKFSANAEYLFFTGLTAVMSEWYFDIEAEDIDCMLKRAIDLDRNNILYTWGYSDAQRNNLERAELAKKIIAPGSSARMQLEAKGAVGKYLIGIITTRSITNKDKLYKRIDEYLFGQITISTFCYSCRCYYTDGLRGREFNELEQMLLSELSEIAIRYIKSTESPTAHIGIPFSESELREKALQAQQILKL